MDFAQHFEAAFLGEIDVQKDKIGRWSIGKFTSLAKETQGCVSVGYSVKFRRECEFLERETKKIACCIVILDVQQHWYTHTRLSAPGTIWCL